MGLVESFSYKPFYWDIEFQAEAPYPKIDQDILPGDTVRFGIRLNAKDDDLSERVHYIEFVDTSEEGLPKVVAGIRHKLTATSSMQAIFQTISSEYQLKGFGKENEILTQEEVELKVQEIIRDVKNLNLQRFR